MLIQHGEMVAIILHELVPSAEPSEHVHTLGDLFRYSGTMLRSCSSKSRMTLFGHTFCRGDFTVDRSVFLNSPNSTNGCSFKNLFFSFPMTFCFFSLEYRHTPKDARNKRNLVTTTTWALRRYLGDWIRAGAYTSTLNVLAPKVRRSLHRRVTV
jgi:hypothetical protein